jgi:GT2 family glycosyltransferase
MHDPGGASDAAVPSKTGPAVSVTLVTYHGERWLETCIGSVLAQSEPSWELLVLDNASGDGTWDALAGWAARDARIRVERSEENLGFAGGQDRLLRGARGDVVLLLNQDAALAPGYLAAVLGVFRARPDVGSVQGRMRRLGPDGERLLELDTTGLVMLRDRRAVSRGQGSVDGPEHGLAGSVWGVDGPAPAYRMAALREARLPRRGGGWEILDTDFFLYKEDVDLAWRLRRLGWEAWYEPAALGWHGRGTGGTGATGWLDIARTNWSIGRRAKILSWRNQRLMQVKNETVAGYLRDLPWILRREVLSLGFIVVFDPKRLVAIPMLLRDLPSAMRKRIALGRAVARADARRRSGGPPPS